MMKQPIPPKRITMRSIGEDTLDIFNLERGLIYTVVALTLRPGAAIRTYLYEDRTKLVKPFRFLLLTIAAATFLTVQYFKYFPDAMGIQSSFTEGYELGANASGVEDAEVVRQRAEAMAKRGMEIYTNYFNLILLAGVPVLAFATGVVFRRKMNYAEHLVTNSYVTGYMTLVYILMMPLLWVMSFFAMSQLYALVLIGYSVWAYKQTYQERLLPAVGKTITATILYLLLYYLMIGIFAFLLIIIKGLPQ